MVVRVTHACGGLEEAFKADEEYDSEFHRSTVVVLSASRWSLFRSSRSDDAHVE
jgi:hypothetical protein